MGSFSLIHWVIIAVFVMLLFGGSRFSSMMGDVAKGLKSFKQGMADEDDKPGQPRVPADPRQLPPQQPYQQPYQQPIDITPHPAPAQPAAPAAAPAQPAPPAAAPAAPPASDPAAPVPPRDDTAL